MNLTLRYANENFDIPFQQQNHEQLVGVGGSLVDHLNDTVDGILALNYTRQFADIPTNSFQEMVMSVGLQKRF